MYKIRAKFDILHKRVGLPRPTSAGTVTFQGGHVAPQLSVACQFCGSIVFRREVNVKTYSGAAANTSRPNVSFSLGVNDLKDGSQRVVRVVRKHSRNVRFVWITWVACLVLVPTFLLV